MVWKAVKENALKHKTLAAARCMQPIISEMLNKCSGHKLAEVNAYVSPAEDLDRWQ